MASLITKNDHANVVLLCLAAKRVTGGMGVFATDSEPTVDKL